MENPVYKLTPREEACLKVSKEIAVKFIELGRLNLGSFAESFANIYEGVHQALDSRRQEESVERV